MIWFLCEGRGVMLRPGWGTLGALARRVGRWERVGGLRGEQAGELAQGRDLEMAAGSLGATAQFCLPPAPGPVSESQPLNRRWAWKVDLPRARGTGYGAKDPGRESRQGLPAAPSGMAPPLQPSLGPSPQLSPPGLSRSVRWRRESPHISGAWNRYCLVYASWTHS